MVVNKLGVTQKLEELASENSLNSSISVLNLPAMRYCERSCPGCVTGEMSADPDKRMNYAEILDVMDYFSDHLGTKIVTINGRGDPFHPQVKDETLLKVNHAALKRQIPYVFTSGDNLDQETCDVLASCGANVMVSLFGNRFIDENFFDEKQYSGRNGVVADNLRKLISTYAQGEWQPEAGLTRLGMNYVITEMDLADNGEKVARLRDAANENGLFFVCNVDFGNDGPELRSLAKSLSNFSLDHSTFVDGVCHMGAGSSATIDYDGAILRCPYLANEMNDGNFFQMSEQERSALFIGYMYDKKFSCVLRERPKSS
ncbi:MAG: hypothetical protein ABIG93_01425 [archaeon]